MRQHLRAWLESLIRGGAGPAQVIALAVFAPLACMPANVASAQASAPEGSSGAVFERFVASWAGHYDNRRQHAAQLASGLPEAQRNPSLELRIVRIDAPAFGPRAFYAEWFAPADMAPLSGCDVGFRAAGGAFAGEAFAGEMEKGRCRFPSFEEPSREIYSWSQMTKTDRVVSYKDGWFNVDGSLYRSWAPEWYVFEKR